MLFLDSDLKSNPIRLKGVTSTPLSDLYYFLMQARWEAVLCLFAATLLAINAVFGLRSEEQPHPPQGGDVHPFVGPLLLPHAGQMGSGAVPVRRHPPGDQCCFWTQI